MDVLRRAESAALQLVDVHHIPSRLREFRNALLHLTITGRDLPTMPIHNHGHLDELHVMVVDDCPVACAAHTGMLHMQRPRTLVHECSTAAAAIEYARESAERGNPVELILLDLHLDTTVDAGTLVNLYTQGAA